MSITDDVDEGSLVKMIVTLEQVCKNVKLAVTSIGDSTLATRMD
jgi:superfamily II RNA helicase